MLGPATGAIDELEADGDRIQVQFEDGVEVDIRIDDDEFTIDEDRSCDEGSDESSPTTTTSEPDDDDDDEPDDEDDPDDD